jgi:ribulose kinase
MAIDLANRLHVLPDFHGNRSPLADPHAVGVISGPDARRVVRQPVQSSTGAPAWRIALGVRHILDTLNDGGFVIDTLHVTGGHTRNPILMELYADATGCRVVEPLGDDAVLTGSGMAAAAAAGLYPSLAQACAGMRQQGRERRPNAAAHARFDRDYRVFLEMHRQREALERME